MSSSLGTFGSPYKNITKFLQFIQLIQEVRKKENKGVSTLVPIVTCYNGFTW